MKHPQRSLLASTAAAVLFILLVSASASATELYQRSGGGNITQTAGTVVSMSLPAGTSLVYENTPSTLVYNTCGGFLLEAKLDKAGGIGSNPGGKVSSLIFGACNDTTVAIGKGEIEIKYVPGTTNGTLISMGTEVTYFDTMFGFWCFAKTGLGTTIGTITGAGSSGGHATVQINAVLNAGICGNGRWTGTLTMTTPTGLVVEEK